MAKSLSILFVTSEVFPFSKESGVGDVSYSLPLALREAGNDVRVMMPKYGNISERKNRIHEINRLRDIPIPMGEFDELATVKSSSIQNPKTKVQAYITTNYKYFDSLKGVYHDPKSWKPYENNAERFTFFNRSVIETCLLLGWFPDIIHCNDWQTALIPAYIKTMYPEEFKNTKTVFTVHNFYQQGSFDKSFFEETGLPESEMENFIQDDKFNFIKGGVHYSDFITTVSPTYAKEILEDEKYTLGLNKLLKEKAKEGNYKGILNGIDEYAWDPGRDNIIKSKYKGDFEEYKYDNKVDLITTFDFEFDPSKPLITMIPKIGDQKGVPLFIEAADEIFKNDIQMILLGEGGSGLKKQLKEIEEKYPEKFKTVFAFDQEMAHRLEAGSDIFLMPSQYEPCGLNLMYSMLYGTVPVVRTTGGLNDIAKEFDAGSGEGNSFTFEDYSKDALLEAFSKAVETFKDKETWMKIVENGMNEDFSWDEGAKEYEEIYKKLKS